VRLPTVLFALLVAVPAVPQSILDFDDWMQRIDESSQDLQRGIDARDVAAAKLSAREIEELYGAMEKFFEKRGETGNATRWSREGADWARAAQRDLDAKRFKSAKRHALAIAHGCRDCHDQYKPL
jgi:hypothetical protein